MTAPRLDASHDRPLCILIVDDDADTRESMALVLRRSGFQTMAAGSGPDALQVAESEAPDIVLLDLAMPGMDGLQVAQRFRERACANGKRPFLIALSGYGDAQTRQRCSLGSVGGDGQNSAFSRPRGGARSPYAPRTLDVQLDHAEAGVVGLLTELLALTKMNWNSTELINLEPITLSAARSVGSILRHIPPGRAMQSRFSFFM